jgi:hypothetical protein
MLIHVHVVTIQKNHHNVTLCRLKEDVSDHKSRCETLTSERDSSTKELERLKSHNSDDLYIPQLKEVCSSTSCTVNITKSFINAILDIEVEIVHSCLVSKTWFWDYCSLMWLREV